MKLLMFPGEYAQPTLPPHRRIGLIILVAGQAEAIHALNGNRLEGSHLIQHFMGVSRRRKDRVRLAELEPAAAVAPC
jgi:hypothetical protein